MLITESTPTDFCRMLANDYERNKVERLGGIPSYIEAMAFADGTIGPTKSVDNHSRMPKDDFINSCLDIYNASDVLQRHIERDKFVSCCTVFYDLSCKNYERRDKLKKSSEKGNLVKVKASEILNSEPDNIRRHFTESNASFDENFYFDY